MAIPAKKGKSPVSKKKKQIVSGQTKVGENLDCLFELHKLQGALLEQLRRDLQ